jgi:hypothetical protein
MSVKTKKRPAVVRAALMSFIGRMRSIPTVEYVALPEGGPPEIFTLITRNDKDVCYEIIRAQNSVLREFPESEIMFHIWFLNGQDVTSIVENSEIYFDARQDA